MVAFFRRRACDAYKLQQASLLEMCHSKKRTYKAGDTRQRIANAVRKIASTGCTACASGWMREPDVSCGLLLAGHHSHLIWLAGKDTETEHIIRHASTHLDS